MEDELKDRVKQRLDELGISAREAARRGGGSESMVRNVLNGASLNPRGDTLGKLAKGLEVTEQWLLKGDAAGDGDEAGDARPARSEVRLADISIKSIGQLPKDVPVMGTVAASELGKGAFQFTSEVIDYVRRPFGVLGDTSVYALYVEGESMMPRFEPGDLVFVHPGRKPRGGDYVVIQEPDTDNGGPRGYIKRLVTITGKLIRTQQFNPAASLDFVIRPGILVHKVLNEGELYGI